jgi:hypothetical protein
LLINNSNIIRPSENPKLLVSVRLPWVQILKTCVAAFSLLEEIYSATGEDRG